MWLDWAFSLEPPTGFSGNTFEPSGPVSAAVQGPTPRPALARDDDDAVELVWGSAEDQGEDNGPVVLEDVPDVSGKHLAPRAETFTTDSLDDLDDIDDIGDIPAPLPSHGNAAASPRARTSSAMRAPTADVVPDLEQSRPRPRTSNPPPTGTARDSGLEMEDLLGPDPLDDDDAATLSGAPAVARAKTVEPVVRFSKTGQLPAVRAPSTPPPPLADSALEPLRAHPRTRPGVAPAAAPRSSPASLAPATHKPVIGASMVERHKPRRWPLVLGLVLIAAGGAGVALYVTNMTPAVPSLPPSPPPAAGPASVKFDVTPSDAEIRIDGIAHTGSPWNTELAPGTHQIEIRRSGYTAYLTSLVLSPADKHSLHIELRPLGTAGASTEATLSVSTTPSGLEAELDGVVLAQHTPIKMPLAIGTHTIVVKKAGLEVWRQIVNAEAASEYEFNPSFAAAAPIAAMTAGGPAPRNDHTVAKTATDQFITEDPAPAPVVPADAAIEVPAITPTLPMPAPVPAPAPPPVPVPVPPAPAPIVPSGPVTVPPNAVTKLSGEAPNISRYRSQTMPAVTAAKLCIDRGGAVMSVDFLTHLDKRVAHDLQEQLKTWKYRPYVHGGTAVVACFVVTMRMK